MLVERARRVSVEHMGRRLGTRLGLGLLDGVSFKEFSKIDFFEFLSASLRWRRMPSTLVLTCITTLLSSLA